MVPFRPLAIAWILGVCIPQASTSAADEFSSVLPFESDGDLQFFVDASAYRGADTKTTEEEIYVAISNDQLVLKPEADGVYRGDLSMRVTVRDETGKELSSSSVKLAPEAASERDAADRGVVQNVRQPVRLPPGRHLLEVRVQDERSQRPGLWNRMRNNKKQGMVHGWIEIPDFANSELELSDLTLARTLESVSGDAAFGRNGVNFDPNPARRFGLAVPIVRSYLEVYGGDGFTEGTTFLVRTRVVDRSGATVMRRTTRASPQRASFVLTEEVPLRPREVPPGTYRLELEVQNERTQSVARSAADFEVIWAAASWSADPASALQEMRLLMTQAEYRTLEGLSEGAREIYLAEYWSELDPDPATPENESLNEFRARIQYADQNFASTLERGILSDRGRVFVRYGPADDILTEFSSSGFGSEGGNERVAGPQERVRLGTRPSTSFLDPDEFREGDVSGVAEQRGGSNIEAKELEVWVYDGPGHPLTENQDLDRTSHRGLKFIFADEMGNGNFILIGSSGTSIY